MNKLLLIIDLQKGFINDNTKNIPNAIEELLNKNIFNYVIFTKYINDEDSIFYKKLNYKGCMSSEDRNIVIDTKNYKIMEKRGYTALNDELKDYIKENNIEKICVCGLDTDACVLKTAIDLFENEYNVKVIKDLCMSHSGIEMNDSAINILSKMIGKDNVIDVEEL